MLTPLIAKLECEHCGANLMTEDNVIELCNDPFNGMVAVCECGAEYEFELFLKSTKISGPTNGDEDTDEDDGDDPRLVRHGRF